MATAGRLTFIDMDCFLSFALIASKSGYAPMVTNARDMEGQKKGGGKKCAPRAFTAHGGYGRVRTKGALTVGY